MFLRNLTSITFFFLAYSIYGQDYFQQDVDYQITVSLDDQDHFLHGFETIAYTNNSDETLSELYFHLWPNAYRDNSTALNKQMREENDFRFHFSDFSERGYLDSLSFSQNGVSIKLEYDDQHPDICKLLLDKPINPGESTTLTTPFRVKIPSGRFSRLGHTKQAYYITQWYPKPAVYDKDGWHTMPYLNQGEFYSEFGSFEVSITLPENYVVGATGDLQEESEIEWMKDLAAKTEALDKYPADRSFPESSANVKTITFKQNNVHDFAWFADKRFNVLYGQVALPNSTDTVDLWSLFTNSDVDYWDNSIEYLHDGVHFYSKLNGNYPYKHCTAIDGTISAGGGMEYPNITIIGRPSSAISLEVVIVHEVGHNWFYGILGSNERDYAWMDEGINSYYEHRYFLEKYPDNSDALGAYFPIKVDLSNNKRPDVSYFLGNSRNSEQPIQLHSSDYTPLNYGTIVYEKASHAFTFLEHYLGTDLFDKCMQQYFLKWKFKHPQPKDIQDVFELETGKDLSWFFEGLLQTNASLDHCICGKQENSFCIKNKSNIPIPISLGALKDKKLLEEVWSVPATGNQTIKLNTKEYDEVRIDPLFMGFQSNRRNDIWNKKGLIKTWEPLKLSYGSRIRDRKYAHLYYVPLVGWNQYDHWMLGLNLTNFEVFHKPVEFSISPLYSFNQEKLNGFGRLNWNIRPNHKNLRFVELFTNLSSFTYYDDPFATFWFEKIQAGINAQLRPERLRSGHQVNVNYRWSNISNHYDFVDDPDPLDSVLFLMDVDTSFSIHEIGIEFWDKNDLLRTHADVNLRIRDGSSRITFSYENQLIYNSKKRRVSLRLFAGRFLNNSQINNSERIYLTANNNQLSEFATIRDQVDGNLLPSNQDYLYDEVFLARTETNGLLGRQLYFGQGNFKVPVVGLSSDNWIYAVNFESDFPLPLNIGMFYSYGGFKSLKNTSAGLIEENNSNQELGLKLTIVRDYFTIYFPLFFDNDNDPEFDHQDINFVDNISFNLNLTELSPRNLRNKIPF